MMQDIHILQILKLMNMNTLGGGGKVFNILIYFDIFIMKMTCQVHT